MLQGWRTVISNALAVLPVLAEVVVSYSQEPGAAEILPEEWIPYYTLAVILMNVYLRTITKTPIGRKEE